MTVRFRSWIILGLFALGLALFNWSCQSEPFKQGKILYSNFCANCHMDDGSGLESLFPPLANADFIKEDPLTMVCIIRKGMEGEITVNGRTYNQAMEAIPQLSEFEIANIINYINQAWGNDLGFVKLADVRSRLETCE